VSEFYVFRNGFTLSWELAKGKLEAVARAFWYFFAEKKVQRETLYM
jgi:hypothetical protein